MEGPKPSVVRTLFPIVSTTYFDLDLSESSSSEDEEIEKSETERSSPLKTEASLKQYDTSLSTNTEQLPVSTSKTSDKESTQDNAKHTQIIAAPTCPADLKLSESSSSEEDDSDLTSQIQKLDTFLKQNDPVIKTEKQTTNVEVFTPIIQPRRISHYNTRRISTPLSAPPTYMSYPQHASRRSSLICADLTRHYKNTSRNEITKTVPQKTDAKEFKNSSKPKQKRPTIPIISKQTAAAAVSTGQTNRKLTRNSTKSSAALTDPEPEPPSSQSPLVPAVASSFLDADLGLVLTSSESENEEAEALMKIEKIAAMEEFINQEIPAIVKQTETKTPTESKKPNRKRRQNSSPMSPCSSLGSPEQIPDYQPGSMKLRLRRIWRGRHSHWIIVTGEEIKAEDEDVSLKT